MVEAYEYTDEELRKCGDAIVWTTIYAAVHNDGVVDESEKAEAIKQTHVRSFSTEAYLMPIYKHLDANFESLFDAYSSTLTGTLEEKEELIQAKISEALERTTFCATSKAGHSRRKWIPSMMASVETNN